MPTVAFIRNLSVIEWIVILAIVLLFFGATRIPKLMRGLGVGMREFKSGLKDDPEAARAEPRTGTDARSGKQI